MNSNHPLYPTWKQMRYRCNNPNVSNYAEYGGKGITVCKRWMNSFHAFLADMGPKPSRDHSIDRIDNKGNYSPENCRWATKTTQSNNRRDNVMLTYNGKTQTLAQWARELNVNYRSLKSRIDLGWSIDRIFSTPIRLRRTK